MKKNLKLFLLTVLGTWMAGSAMAEEHYLVGGATTPGWTTGEWNRSPVAMVNVSDNVWVWAGRLTASSGDDGRFKIPNTADGWNGYWATEQDKELSSEWSDLSENGDGDKKFRVAEEGVYRITINTSTLKIKAEKMAEPSKDGDYYQIATVNDYYWYAGKVTSGEQTLKARMTADLDFENVGFFPLACDRFKYKGEFDGAGHAITNAVIIGSNNNVGFIRYATGSANIHDLVIEGSFTGSVKVGGVIGFARDGGEITLTNVINKANVTATAGSDGNEGNAAGLVACATDGTKVIATNCANMGEVKGQDGQCAAFAGWTQSGTKFTNCWNSGAIYNMENNCNLYRNTGSVTASNCWDASGNNAYTQGTKVAPATLTTGEFCYTLNGNQSEINWYQNLTGTVDACPVPFSTHAQVYANGELQCDGITPVAGGTISFSNASGNTIENHNFNEWGFCDNKPNGTDMCNEFKPDLMTPVNGYYEIGTKEQLNWFAVKVNGHNTYHSSTPGVRDINGKLTADIDFSDQTNMIGNGDEGESYQGIFDGQGHKVKVAYAVSQKNVALFRYLKNATIKNLITEGTINNENNSCAGGIFAGSRGNTVVENCVSYVKFTRTNDGDATIGGIGAYMHDKGSIKNCAFYGEINTPNAEGNGGILGYANGGDNNKLENCVVNGTLSYTNNTVLARNTNSVTNCYFVESNGKTAANATAITAEQVASGYLAYKLNGNSSANDVVWHQKLGEGADAAPLPFGTYIVYANGILRCDGITPKEGTELTFSNTAGNTIENHDFTDGFCSFCDVYDPLYMTANGDGYYEVSTGNELRWTAVESQATPAIKVKLMNDIDMSSVKFDGFASNNSDDKRFTGEIDGQGHKIFALTMNVNRDGVGLVNTATVGAVIKNLTMASSCDIKGSSAVAAFIGAVRGSSGNLFIENCGNEGAVTATGANGAGFIGCKYDNDVIPNITNCYNIGIIHSGKEGGSFSGWMPNAKVTNCYSIVDPAEKDGNSVSYGFEIGKQFARGGNIQLKNCYDYGTGNWDNNGTWGDCFIGSHKITDPDDELQMATAFAGLFDGEGGNVWRMEYTGWAHPVVYEPETLVVKEDRPMRVVAQENVNTVLYRTLVADVWNTFCVPFNITNAELKSTFGDDVQVAVYSETAEGESSTVNFNKMTTPAITANVPVLLKVSNGNLGTGVYDFSNRTIAAGEAKVAGEKNFDFVGTYEPSMAIADGDYFLSADKLYKSTGTTTIAGTRAYIKAKTANARIVNLNFGDETTTGIANVNVNHNDKVYDLQGRRVNNPTKGMYIVNGKKVIK